VGIKVSPDLVDMVPRMPLVSVPYGYKAEEADHAVYSDTALYAWDADFNFPSQVVKDTVNEVFNVVNTYNGTFGSAIRGRHEYTGHYGVLGSGGYGAMGRHVTTGNYGTLGSDEVGVYGFGQVGKAILGEHYSSGNLGYMGSQLYGVYGEHGDTGDYGIMGGSVGLHTAGVYGENGTTGDYGILGGLDILSNKSYGVYGNGSSTAWAGYFDGKVFVQDSLGIGIIFPSEELEVIGTIKTDRLKMSTGASDGYVLTSDASGEGTWQESIGFTLPVDDTVAASDVAFRIVNTIGTAVYGEREDTGFKGMLGTSIQGVYGEDPTGGNWGALGTGASGVIGVSALGRAGSFLGDVYCQDDMGIGTTTPETKLHVEGDITVDQKILADDSGGLELATDEGTTRLKINDNGYVGVGTANPGVKFHATILPAGYSSWASSTDFVFENNGNSVVNIVGNLANNSELQFSDNVRSRGAVKYEHGNDRLTFKTAGVENRMVISSTGDIGIGTTAPEYKVDVRGNRIQLKEDGTGHWVAMRTDGYLVNLGFGGAGLVVQSDSAGEHILMNPTSGNSVAIGAWVPEERLHVNGKIYVSSMDGTSSGSPVRWYNNRLYYQSSSRKYKDDIQPLDDNFDKILDAEPVSFIDKASGERNIGFIAEDMEDLGLEHLVVHRDGEPDGVKYELVSVYLLQMIKQIKAENDELKQEIEDLKARFN
jgi:hypothetical protein